MPYTHRIHTVRTLFMVAATFLFFLSGSMTPIAHAEESASHTGFSSTLGTPPAFTPPAGTADEEPDCSVPANTRAHPMTCTVSNQRGPTRSASIKNGYLDNPDATVTPRLGNISPKKMEKALASSQKNGYDWDVKVELRESAVVEETGNAKRNESLGGLVKGNIRF